METAVDAKHYDHNYYINENDGHREFREGLDVEIHEKFKRFFDILNPVSEKNILDIGCGRGEIAYYAAKKGCEIYSVDYSIAAVEITKKTLERLPDEQRRLVRVQCVDIINAHIEEKFDYIVMIDVLEHLTVYQTEVLFEKFGKLLKEGGKVFISTPNGLYEQFFYNLKHIVQYPWKPVKTLFRIFKGKYKPKNFKEFLSKTFRIIPKKDQKLEIMHVNVMTPWALRELMLKQGLIPEFFSGKGFFDREMVVIGSLARNSIINNK